MCLGEGSWEGRRAEGKPTLEKPDLIPGFSFGTPVCRCETRPCLGQETTKKKVRAGVGGGGWGETPLSSPLKWQVLG